MPQSLHPEIQTTENEQLDFELYLSDEISEPRLAMLMNDASIDQILALDLSLKVTAWNRACEQATGIARESALGSVFTELLPGIANFPHIMAALVKALKGLKSFVPSEKGAYNGGYSEHHFIPLKSATGVIGVMVVIHDVAHRIKAEQELQRLNKELAAKARELKEKTDELAQFNWIASHDLKEPLRKIYTFIEMVATKEGIRLSDAGRSNLRRAQSAAQRMGLLTDDIATFTQVAAPNEDLMTVDLAELLEDVIERQKRQINNCGATIEKDALPLMNGYPEILKLLFSHLLANALKFHPEGQQPHITIISEKVCGNTIAHPLAEPQVMYNRISVQDNGIGFAAEYSEKIFGMFQRLNPDATFKGTGMGLAICRKAAAAHKGFIIAAGKEGSDAVFHVYLPDSANANRHSSGN